MQRDVEVLLNIPQHPTFREMQITGTKYLVAKSYLYSISILIYGVLLNIIRKNNSEPCLHVHFSIVDLVIIAYMVKIEKSHKYPTMEM